MRSLAAILIVVVLWSPFSACRKKQQGHFSSRSSKPSRVKTNPGNQNINDCDVMEKNRTKRAKQAQKNKRPDVKAGKADKSKTLAKDNEGVPKKKSEVKGKSKKKKEIPFAVKLGVIALLGLGAIAFVVISLVVVLLTFALSILLVPLVISLASFLISSIAFGFIKIHESLRRRRWRKEEEEFERLQEEQELEKQRLEEPQQKEEESIEDTKEEENLEE